MNPSNKPAGSTDPAPASGSAQLTRRQVATYSGCVVGAGLLALAGMKFSSFRRDEHQRELFGTSAEPHFIPTLAAGKALPVSKNAVLKEISSDRKVVAERQRLEKLRGELREQLESCARAEARIKAVPDLEAARKRARATVDAVSGAAHLTPPSKEVVYDKAAKLNPELLVPIIELQRRTDDAGMTALRLAQIPIDYHPSNFRDYIWEVEQRMQRGGDPKHRDRIHALIYDPEVKAADLGSPRDAVRAIFLTVFEKNLPVEIENLIDRFSEKSPKHVVMTGPRFSYPRRDIEEWSRAFRQDLHSLGRILAPQWRENSSRNLKPLAKLDVAQLLALDTTAYAFEWLAAAHVESEIVRSLLCASLAVEVDIAFTDSLKGQRDRFAEAALLADAARDLYGSPREAYCKLVTNERVPDTVSRAMDETLERGRTWYHFEKELEQDVKSAREFLKRIEHVELPKYTP